MPLVDAQLLFFRVSRDFDDFHPVLEGREDRIDEVRGGDEHHLGQVKRHPQIVIAEGMVLLRVQDLEKGGRRIPTKVHAYLVHFVHHEDRVVGAGLFDPLEDASGQCADIGATVASDFGLIADSTQADAYEFAPQRPGNRLAERGFPHARGADETEEDRKSTRLNSSHRTISYAVFCLKKKKTKS